MRADLYLYIYENVKSRQQAKKLIDGQNVRIDGKAITKPSQEIDENIDHTVEILNQPRFVSRGGEKLDYALNSFEIDVIDMNCIDVGASTGGFTDCLLQRGAKSVYAVDSGHSQLDPCIEEDPRVVSIEKFNARFMEATDFPHAFDIAVMDVSFISQTLIHPSISKILTEEGYFVTLIKPQFECGKSALNSHGIVKKSLYHTQAVQKVIDSALICGFSCVDLVKSPIEGGSGNTEFLALFQKSTAPIIKISENKIKTITQSK